MTSRCSEDCEGRVKINRCYCNSLPSGTFHGPTRLFCGPGHGHSAGLGARRPLGADGFFVCVFFILARASVSLSKRIFGAFCCFSLLYLAVNAVLG